MTEGWRDVIGRYPELTMCGSAVDEAVETLCNVFTDGKKLLLCGNGGSAADCEHISGELLKGFLLERKLTADQRRDFAENTTATEPDHILDSLQQGVPAIPIASLTSAGTAFTNDVGAELCFAQLVYALGTPGDALMALSTSGNAENVCYAAQVARGLGMSVIALSGGSGGKLAKHATCLITSPAVDTYLVQEHHVPIYHYLCSEVERRLFGGET